MKKLILMSGVFLALASMTSCKKEFRCECDKTYTDAGGSTTQNYSNYTYKDNRVDAEGKCSANEKTGSDLGGPYTINCSID